MNLGTIMTMAGGLGLFLFGMKLMSQAIEKAAGARLRRILEIFTTNRFTGMLVGIFFTAAIQSSSACTAMVVSFVNAGLMNLYQAAGVIFGANIGTTITSQLVSFNFSAVAPLILLIGVLIVMFAKKEQLKQIGEIIVGFGILFVGLETMKNAMAVLKDNAVVVDTLSSLRNPFVATLIGTALTAIIQSSSVTVSIALLMAQQDLLSLNIVLYLILGCNIGATATALLASLSGKKDAKRAALIHFWFNVIGTVIIYIVLAFAMNPVVNGLMAISNGNNGRFVANAHTLIKVFQVIVLFPFMKPIVKLSCACVRGEDQKVGYRAAGQLKYIGNKVVFNPATAVVEVIKELDRMASLASENLNRAMNALITLDKDDINEVYEVLRIFAEPILRFNRMRVHRRNVKYLDSAKVHARFGVNSSAFTRIFTSVDRISRDDLTCIPARIDLLRIELISWELFAQVRVHELLISILVASENNPRCQLVGCVVNASLPS